MTAFAGLRIIETFSIMCSVCFRIGHKENDVNIIQLQVSVTLDRKWVKPDVNITLDCLFLHESGKEGKQQCCKHLEDGIYSSEDTTMSYQGRFLFRMIGAELVFEGEEIPLNDLRDTKMGGWKVGVINEANITQLIRLLDTTEPSFLDKLWVNLKEYSLKAILPSLMVIGSFVVMICTRKRWGPLLLEKVPKLDKWLHSNRLETRSQKSVDSDDSWELVQAEDLYSIDLLPPEELEVAEEAVDEAAENEGEIAVIENFGNGLADQPQHVVNGLNVVGNVNEIVPQLQAEENQQHATIDDEIDVIQVVQDIGNGRHVLVDVEIDAIQSQADHNRNFVLTIQNPDGVHILTDDEDTSAFQLEGSIEMQESNIRFVGLESGVNLQDLSRAEDEA